MKDLREVIQQKESEIARMQAEIVHLQKDIQVLRAAMSIVEGGEPAPAPAAVSKTTGINDARLAAVVAAPEEAGAGKRTFFP